MKNKIDFCGYDKFHLAYLKDNNLERCERDLEKAVSTTAKTQHRSLVLDMEQIQKLSEDDMYLLMEICLNASRKSVSLALINVGEKPLSLFKESAIKQSMGVYDNLVHYHKAREKELSRCLLDSRFPQ
jgi:hypothetical protein